MYPAAHAFRGNSFTQWGNLHEPRAEEAFSRFVRTFAVMGALSHPDGLKHHEHPWLSASPDAYLTRGVPDEERGVMGDAMATELVEYKCPASARNAQTDAHPYKAHARNVPAHYLDQIQGSMHLMRMLGHPDTKRAWFVCWTPARYWVTHVPYLPEYTGRLVATLKRRYFDEFMPACVEALVKADLAGDAPPSAEVAEAARRAGALEREAGRARLQDAVVEND